MSESSGSQSNSPGGGAPLPRIRLDRAPRYVRRRRQVLVVFLLALALVVLGVRGVAGALEADGVSAVAEPVTSPVATAPAEATEPATAAAEVTEPATAPESGPGTYLGARESIAAASSQGTLKRFDVQVEDGLEIEAGAAAVFIAEVLNDERSWRGTGRWRFELVPAGEPAELHAYLVTPGTTDKLCAPLDTSGEVSCQNGSKVVLNALRWVRGVPDYEGDLTGYRRYLVNHEFGHAIGHRHVGCPGPDRPAPVMMQQTKGLGDCRRNPWPADD